jgi:large subunit ribosomal protein L10
LNRDEKAAAVAEISEQIAEAQAIFAIDYRGISVPQAAELRSRLREADASFRVVKNRLTKLAAEKADREALSELLEGPTALTFVSGDTALAAKALRELGRQWRLLEFKGGFMDGDALDADQFQRIASLPAREALNGQFVGVLASPLTGLVRGLGSMISGLAIQLEQISEKGLLSYERPAAEEPAADEELSLEQPLSDEPAAEEPEPVPQPEEPAEEGSPAGGEPVEEAADEEQQTSDDSANEEEQ